MPTTKSYSRSNGAPLGGYSGLVPPGGSSAPHATTHMTNEATGGLTAPTDSSTDTEHDPETFTRFQIDLLAVLNDGARYGLAINRALETAYGEEVYHGRLYPNLDDLVDRGLVSKRALDKRTNEYAITDAGAAVLDARRRFLGGEA